MARIRSLVRDTGASRPHPTEVECGWQVLTSEDGHVLLQLSTYGSDDRRSEKKVSQTIQIDASIAAELSALLRDTFGESAVMSRPT